MGKRDTKQAWQPSQNRVLGKTLAIAGFLTFAASIIPAAMAQSDSQNDGLLILLSLFMFFGGAILVIYGKRHLTRCGRELLAQDTRAPIIFLRSFEDQSRDFTLRGFLSSLRLMFGNRNLGMGVSTWGPTLQTQLALIFNRIGPYIAVGLPGAKLPGTGAARLYLSENNWQQEVKELLDKACLVVIRSGTSDGLHWEIETVLKSTHNPEQLLMILPATKKEYFKFNSLMNRYNITLPEKLPNTILMTFTHDLKPIFLEPKGHLEDTLTPYFRQNSIEPPPHSALDAFRLFFT